MLKQDLRTAILQLKERNQSIRAIARAEADIRVSQGSASRREQDSS